MFVLQESLEIVIFSEDTIVKEPVENWPFCHCLIGFHAEDFPLEKAKAYAEFRQPYVINDLERQSDLLDRYITFEYCLLVECLVTHIDSFVF